MNDYIFPPILPYDLSLARPAREPAAPAYPFGNRIDSTAKGWGFANTVSPDGELITEMSLGPENMLYPSVYPGISFHELMQIAQGAITPQLEYRAYNAALERLARGLSPFYTP